MICKTVWERDNEISRICAAGIQPDSVYLSDIKAWAIEEENTVMAIAREQDVIKWANERGIFEQSNPESQHAKTCEEVRELSEALAVHDRAEIKDALGDITVTLILQAKMHGWTLGECLESAYQVIKNRKGRMEGGLFVKES